MAVNTGLSAAAVGAFAAFNILGNSTCRPQFLCIYDSTSKWKVFPVDASIYRDNKHLIVRWRGLWINDTGSKFSINFILLAGNTSSLTIPSQDWLEDYLNTYYRSPTLSQLLYGLPEQTPNIAAAGLTGSDIVEVENGAPLIVNFEFDYGQEVA